MRGQPPTRMATRRTSRLHQSKLKLYGVRKSAGLTADSETGDERFVTLRLGFLEVVQKPAALCHQSQETTARMEIFRVGPEMLLKLKDSLAQKGNLDFGRPHVVLLPPVLADYYLLYVCRQSHA